MFYSVAKSVASSAQRNLDGGVFTFFLRHYSNISQISRDSSPPPFSAHFVSTIHSSGFMVGIFFGLIWCVGLIIGVCYLGWLRHLKSSSAKRMRANSQPDTIDVPESDRINTRKCQLSTKSKFFLHRRRLQSKWIYLTCQWVLMTSLATLLFVACILGFVTSHSLHNSLTTIPVNSSTPNAYPQKGLFPGLAQAVENARLYLTGFYNETRQATRSSVEQLIEATVKMQNETTYDFNAQLFSMLRIDRAFELGDKLGEHTVRLLNLVVPLKKHYNDYTDTMSSLSMAIARWNGYMEQLHVERKRGAMDACESNVACEIPFLAQAEISVSSHSRLPHFDFAIALNFVTDAQKRTPEAIEEQLNSSRLLASKQLDRTIERMRTELDIPGSLRDLTEKNWQNIATKLTDPLKTIDELAEIIPAKFSAPISVASKYLLAFGWFLWLIMLSIDLLVAWLVYQYHHVPKTIPSSKRRRIRCAASVGIVFLISTVMISCVIFIVAGYAHTELCRYISPGSAISYVSFDESSNPQPNFVLDAHVNSFLDENWSEIVRIAEEMNKDNSDDDVPIPRIRSPIRSLTVGCKTNLGILDAFEAVDTFNYSVLNKPEMTNGFVEKGRLIMRDALLELNATEMFPTALTESVQLASRLDDFLIPFDEVRQQLPWNFLNATTGTGNTTLMSGSTLSSMWNDYFNFLKVNDFPIETLARADELARNVFNLSSEIATLLKSVDGSLQQLEKILKIGPTVNELQGILDNLMDQLRNREDLIVKAMQLYDTRVAAELPRKADLLIHQHGPPIIREVGRCRRLFEAYDAAVSGVCDSVVGPLNGLWLFSGLCTLLSTVLISLALCLLLHKIPPFSHPVNPDGGPLFKNTNHINYYYSRIGTFPVYKKPSQHPLPSLNGVRMNFSPGDHQLIHGTVASEPHSPVPL